MSRFIEETPYTPGATSIVPFNSAASGWNQLELHWCEGCGLLIKNDSLIIYPPGNTRALWFCNSGCKKTYDKKGPAVTILNAEEWGCV